MSTNAMSDVDAVLREGAIRAEQQRSNGEHFAGSVDQLRLTGSNSDSSVRVRIDAYGALRDIKFTEAALERSPQDLREEIMRTIVKVRRELSGRIERLAVDAYGPGSASATLYTDRWRDRFGAPAAGDPR